MSRIKFLAFVFLFILFIDGSIAAIIYGDMGVSLVALVVMIISSGVFIYNVTKHWTYDDEDDKD